MGLANAGFDVTGCDLRPQKRYPFRFAQADALRPPFDLARFDFVWASPPCQEYIPQSKEHPGDLLDATRALLRNVPFYCIENIPRSPVRPDVVLDGDMCGAGTHRRRHFELSFFCLSPPPQSKIRPHQPARIGNRRRSTWRDKLAAEATTPSPAWPHPSVEGRHGH